MINITIGTMLFIILTLFLVGGVVAIIHALDIQKEVKELIVKKLGLK